jgi:glycosyltransferase 2 family protein
LPSAPLTLLQILIGVVDLGFCALAMYLLMPAQPGIDFVSLAVVFILATLLGFASHAPGSIGVFDAAMLVALPEFGREQLVATLVVFRILYFLIPFGIAISAMGTRELWLNVVLPWQERRKLPEACPASATTVPQPVKRLKSKGDRIARG